MLALSKVNMYTHTFESTPFGVAFGLAPPGVPAAVSISAITNKDPGLLCVGDIVVAVNGEDVSKLKLPGLFKKLKSLDLPISVQFGTQVKAHNSVDKIGDDDIHGDDSGCRASDDAEEEELLEMMMEASINSTNDAEEAGRNSTKNGSGSKMSITPASVSAPRQTPPKSRKWWKDGTKTSDVAQNPMPKAPTEKQPTPKDPTPEEPKPTAPTKEGITLKQSTPEEAKPKVRTEIKPTPTERTPKAQTPTAPALLLDSDSSDEEKLVATSAAPKILIARRVLKTSNVAKYRLNTQVQYSVQCTPTFHPPSSYAYTRVIQLCRSLAGTAAQGHGGWWR
jgi:hypothetical protein